MKTLLGTAGLIAAGLFLTAAPNATAEGLPLQSVDVGITGSGVGLGTGPSGSGTGMDQDGVLTTELGLGSVGVGSSAAGGPFIDFGSVRYYLGR